MDKDRFEELCSAYVLGVLEGDELREFEGALREADAEMKQLYVEMKQVAFHLPLTAEAAQPSPRVLAKVLQKIHAPSSEEPKGSLEKFATLLGFGRPQLGFAISFVLLIISAGLGYYSVLLRDEVIQRGEQIVAMQNDLSQQQQHFTALQDELARKEELLKVIQSPKIDVVIMNGLEVNPAGYGKIIWDPDKKSAILQISNLPPVPQDKDYQLWVIKDKVPISAGVFTVNDPIKESLFKIEQLVETDKKSINAFAITLEPKGGVPQPTGAMYLMGTPTL